MYPRPSAAQAAEMYGAASGENPLAALVEVHDGMIAKLREVQSAIADGRLDDRFDLTAKVSRVIDVLQLSLDREQGGEVAAGLDRLYTYFGRRLLEVNLKNDPAICDELICRLSELRDGWRALLDGGVATTMPKVVETASLSA